jgi:hypothetical protein
VDFEAERLGSSLPLSITRNFCCFKPQCGQSDVNNLTEIISQLAVIDRGHWSKSEESYIINTDAGAGVQTHPLMKSHIRD